MGNALLLLLSGAFFGMAGVNIHDVIWCGVSTRGFQVSSIGGRDLEMFFTFFHVVDPSQWDYRTFGLYMGLQSVVELAAATLLFAKFLKIGTRDGNRIHYPHPRMTYGVLVIAAVVLGVVEFIFDSPWYFTDVGYYVSLFVGVPAVGALFGFAGLSLGGASILVSTGARSGR
jgi:hypothetical protein